jgi:hypothetical protein
MEHKHFVDTAIVELLKGGLVKEMSNRPHVLNPLTVSNNGEGKEPPSCATCVNDPAASAGLFLFWFPVFLVCFHLALLSPARILFSVVFPVLVITSGESPSIILSSESDILQYSIWR